MPVMDGIELTQQIRKFNSTIVIWGLTATAQEYERERCLSAGMDTCLFKPVTLSQLSRLLSGVNDANETEFDLERLEVLAQGNRDLMIRALNDAQAENRRDLVASQRAYEVGDYRLLKHHIHRINGTAQLLGVSNLMRAAFSLETKLSETTSDTEISQSLTELSKILDELDMAIHKFTS